MRTINLIMIFLILLFLPMVSSSLGTFKQNECVPIRVLANCLVINITEVTINNNYSYVLNKPMTDLGGQTFNYSFCNTSQLGFYTYSWDNPCVDCSQGDCGNSFIVNGSGQDVSTTQVILIIIGLTAMLIFALFFFVLSFLFKHPGTKIFFMALSSLTLIVLIGIIAANATTYLAEFPSIVSFYNNYYILMTIFAITAMAGLIVWLIYYSVTLFNKSRGRLPDLD